MTAKRKTLKMKQFKCFCTTYACTIPPAGECQKRFSKQFNLHSFQILHVCLLCLVKRGLTNPLDAHAVSCDLLAMEDFVLAGVSALDESSKVSCSEHCMSGNNVNPSLQIMLAQIR